MTISVKLPKEVLSLFPTWEYRCPCCSTYVESNVSLCPNCKTPFNEKMWRVPPRFLKSHDAMSEYAHKVLAPKLTQKQRELLFRYFTELFNDGFESGDFSQWTGTTTGGDAAITVESNNPHHGTYNAKAYTDGGAADTQAYVYKTFGSSYSTLFVRCYFKTDKLPTANDRRMQKPIYIRKSGVGSIASTLIAKDSDGNLEWGVRILTGGAGTFTQYFVDDNTISADTWYCIELEVHIGDSGSFKLYVNGVEKLSQMGIDNNGKGDADEVGVGLRWYQTNRAGTVPAPVEETTYVDCVVVADAYIGPETTEQTYTKTWTTDALFKRFGILKNFAVDARFGSLMSHTISKQIDVLLKRLDATKTFGLDVYFGPVEAEAYTKAFALDAIFAYKVRLPELWLDENGKIVLNISKPYTWVGS